MKTKYLSIDTVRRICPVCAEQMEKRSLKRINVTALLASKMFMATRKAEAWPEPGQCDAFMPEDGFFTRCVSAMGGNVDDAESYCAALHNACLGKWPVEKESTETQGAAQEDKKEALQTESRRVKFGITSPFVHVQKDLTGDVLDVCIAEAGVTLNGDYLGEDMLRRAAPLFENVPAAGYEFSNEAYTDPYYTHVRPEDRSNVGSFIGNVVGFFKNVRFGSYIDERGTEHKGLLAELHVSADWLKKLIVDAFKVGAYDKIGLSMDVKAAMHDEVIEGKIVPCMDEIMTVEEVTVVTNPAAGGRILRVAADYQKPKSKVKRKAMDEIYQWLKENYPDYVVDLPDATEEQIATIVMQALEKMKSAMANAAPMMYDKPDGEKLDGKEKVENKAEGADGNKQKQEDNANANGAANNGNAEVAAIFAEVRKIGGELNTLRSNVQLAKSDELVEAQLALSRLPEVSKAQVRKQFAGKVATQQQVTDAMREQQEIIAAAQQDVVNVPGQVRTVGVMVNAEQYDKFVSAMTGMLLNKDVDNIPRFKSIQQSYREITGFNGSPSEYGDRIMRDALFSTPPLGVKVADWRRRLQYSRESARVRNVQFDTLATTTWAEVYGDSNRRALIAFYKLDQYQDWRKIVSSIVPLPDFRTNRRQRIGGFGDLSEVTEGSTYTELTWPADEEVTYAAVKRGNIVPLTWETFVNDDLGAMQRVPNILGTSAARTLYKFVFNFIRDNPTMDYDSVALFHASHGNLGSTALADAALDDRIFAMKQQTELTSGEQLGVVPKYILVPFELSRTGWEVAKSTVSSLGARTETIENWFAQYGLEMIEVFYWTDATDWALVADPALWPTCEIGFLNGNEEPELFIQDQPLLGSVYTADKMSWKIRHIYGGDILDHRSLDKSVVAG